MADYGQPPGHKSSRTGAIWGPLPGHAVFMVSPMATGRRPLWSRCWPAGPSCCCSTSARGPGSADGGCLPRKPSDERREGRTILLSSHLLAARGAGRPGDDHPQWQAGRDRHASGRPHVIHARPPRRPGQSRGQRRARDAHVPPERPPGQALSETSPAGITSSTPTVGTQVGIPGSTLAGYRRSRRAAAQQPNNTGKDTECGCGVTLPETRRQVPR